MLIGSRLKHRRLELNMSQSDLGKLIGVTKVAISGYENATKQPSLEVFAKIIEVLEISAEYLLGQDISVVSESENNYIIKLAKEDIKIIKELKKQPELYKKLHEDPVRTIELIKRKIN